MTLVRSGPNPARAVSGPVAIARNEMSTGSMSGPPTPKSSKGPGGCFQANDAWHSPMAGVAPASTSSGRAPKMSGSVARSPKLGAVIRVPNVRAFVV